jgi:hypothetical protein
VIGRAAAALGLVALALACASDPPTSSRPATPSKTLPSGQQCLPAMICDAWSGCALIAGNKVVAADQLPAGEPVRVENGCTTGATCTAAKATPAGTQCPLRGIPPKIDPPTYACTWDGTACRSQPK